LKDLEKDLVADVLTDCTPLDNYDSLDTWWIEFKKRFAHRKKEMNKKLKQIEDLEKEISNE
jgi:hypothetical protein